MNTLAVAFQPGGTVLGDFTETSHIAVTLEGQGHYLLTNVLQNERQLYLMWPEVYSGEFWS